LTIQTIERSVVGELLGLEAKAVAELVQTYGWKVGR
jgi:hypothetical protein